MLALIPGFLYSRLRRERVLDNFVRGQVFQTIRLRPGVTYSEIRLSVGVSNGVLAHHLYMLEHSGFVRSEKDGKWRRFYQRDVAASKGGMMMSISQKRIMALVRKHPGLSQSELARRLATKPQNVHYNLARLQEAGLVRMPRVGWSRVCFAVEAHLDPSEVLHLAPPAIQGPAKIEDGKVTEDDREQQDPE